MMYLKEGNKIYIKKKNRGKFTASAKRAGMGVQEYAQKVLKDPNATPLQKRRANFARNAKRQHPAQKGQQGIKVPKINVWKSFAKKINGDVYTAQKAEEMYNQLISKYGMTPTQAIAVVGSAGFETGGTYNPKIGTTYKGLLQWDKRRFPGADYNTQLDYINSSSKDSKQWAPGISYSTFNNPDSTLVDTANAFERGYVRSARGRRRAAIIDNIFRNFVNEQNTLNKIKFKPDGY